MSPIIIILSVRLKRPRTTATTSGRRRRRPYRSRGDLRAAAERLVVLRRRRRRRDEPFWRCDDVGESAPTNRAARPTHNIARVPSERRVRTSADAISAATRRRPPARIMKTNADWLTDHHHNRSSTKTVFSIRHVTFTKINNNPASYLFIFFFLVSPSSWKNRNEKLSPVHRCGDGGRRRPVRRVEDTRGTRPPRGSSTRWSSSRHYNETSSSSSSSQVPFGHHRGPLRF